MTRSLVLVLALVGCKGKEATPAAMADRITCDQYFEHLSAVSKVALAKPYPADDVARCETFTQAQLRCNLAASTMSDLELCSFADTAQRALAVKLTPAIRARWPGTVTAEAIFGGESGCALLALSPGTTPSETAVAATFVLRQLGSPPGRPNVFFAELRKDGGGWHCVNAEPIVDCELLEAFCGPK